MASQDIRNLRAAVDAATARPTRALSPEDEERVGRLMASMVRGGRIEIREVRPQSNWAKRFMGALAVTVAAAAVFTAGALLKPTGPAPGELASVPIAQAIQQAEEAAEEEVERELDAFSATRQTAIVKINGQAQEVQVMHPFERVVLCQQVAEELGLHRVGLDWRDVYSLVHAESGWLPRDGMGNNGKVSRGLGQFEDATARSLGIEDPNDPHQALLGVGKLIKEAAGWAGGTIKQGGVSVYYNLSTVARKAWKSGDPEFELPVETQRHIANVSQGRMIATALGKQKDAFDLHIARQKVEQAHAIAQGAALRVGMKPLDVTPEVLVSYKAALDELAPQKVRLVNTGGTSVLGGDGKVPAAKQAVKPIAAPAASAHQVSPKAEAQRHRAERAAADQPPADNLMLMLMQRERARHEAGT